jgi:DNA polymerase-3 subunit beta
MSFVVSSMELQKHLGSIAGVVPTKSVLPIIQNVHFYLEGSTLQLTATDLENSMRTWLTVENNDEQEQFNLAFPARILQDTLKALPEQPLTFSRDQETNGIIITTDTGEYKINCENGEDFPEFPSAEDMNSISMPLGVLQKAIQKVLFAASTDELKPAMNGMLFEFNSEGATFVATDAHRLVRYRRKDVNADQEISFILPQKALKLLNSAAADADADALQIDYNESNAFFRFGNNLLGCRLIDARFPDYNSVIPASSPAKAILNKSELLGSMKRLDIYSNKTTHLGRFKLSGNLMEVRAEDLDYENRAMEKLHSLYEGEDIEIGFNVALMMDIIANVETEDVIMELESPGRAAVVLPSEQAENEDILMLLMPVMLSNN